MKKRISRPPRKDDRLRQKKRSMKFQMPRDAQIDYKNIALLQKYVSMRGKIMSRRITGVTAKEQRTLMAAIKIGRHLGLLPVGAIKKR